MIIYLTYRLSEKCTMKHNRGGSIPWSWHHYNMPKPSSQKFRWDIMLSRILANLMMKLQQILSRLIENNLSFPTNTHTHTEIPSLSTFTYITSSKVILENCFLMFSHHPGPLLWQLCPPSNTGVRPFLQLPPFSNTMKGALALDKVWGEFFLTWKVKPTKCNWTATKTNSTSKCKTSWKPIS